MKLGIAGNLTRIFINSPLTPLFLIASLLLGALALIVLPREEEPQISVPMVDIHVRADGLKAPDAVKLVSEPLETIIKTIDSVEHVYSQTQDDGVVITARFLVGTSADAAILRIHEKIRANINTIPYGITEPLIVGRGIDDVAIVVATLAPKPSVAPRWSPNQLTRIARELRVDLAKLSDIGLTYIVGDQPEEIRIEPAPEKLSLYGVTLQQLTAKIEGANRSFGLGKIRKNGQQISLVAGQTLQTLSEIGNILITTSDGRPVYIRDVANLSLATSPNETHVFHITKQNDQLHPAPAVSLAIAKRPGTNAVVIAKRITHRIEQLKGKIIPEDINVSITRNYGETANEKANELLFHLGLATISIVILVLFMIGWREAIVIAIVIPTTILLTLFAAWIMGYTLNRVSLFALIFSIGILVDDAIVIIENIARHGHLNSHRAAKRSKVQSAIEAVAEVGNPTIIATLTVVTALLPMLFVSGLMGPYMSPIPANASVAMIFSFFVAVTLTPWLMIRVGTPSDKTNTKTKPSEHGHDIGPLGRFYELMAKPILLSRSRSWALLIVVGIATIGSLSLFYTKQVTVKLLPFDNKPNLQILVDLPEGSSVEATNRALQAITVKLAKVPEIKSFQTHAGTGAPFDFNGLVRHYYLRNSPELGDVVVNLVSKKHRKRSSHAIALELRQLITILDLPKGTALKVVEAPPGPPVLSTLLAEIYGPDPQTRRKVASLVRKAFETVPFIVDVDVQFGKPAMRTRIAINQDNLEYRRVDQSAVYDTLRRLYTGTTVGYSHRGGGRQPIPIRLAPSKQSSVLDERILSTPVPATAVPGKTTIVELGDVVTISKERASYPIFRHNGRAAEMVTAELAGAYEAPIYGMIAVADAIDKVDWGDVQKPSISLYGQPDDESKSTLLWDGEWEVTWVTFRDMGAAFMVALLGIYILVVAQFGSFSLPLVILTPIPLTFIGIMFGHWVLGAAFTATSMIGFIALAGIIVRNSILLVDFIRHADPDQPLRDILLEAGAIRFKPILLTAIAAMIGAAVILFDPIFQGLAISLLFGLASSTLLTVLVVPAIYIIFRDDHRPYKKAKNE